VLTLSERVALIVYCGDHSVAVCPECSEMMHFDELGQDVVLGRRDVCPACNADLTAALRRHLAGCTWMRVQVRETRERAQAIREAAIETRKTSEQLWDRADLVTAQAEAEQQRGRRLKRGQDTGSGGSQ
jgi:hypothetical protein